MLLEDTNFMHFPIVYKKSIPIYALFYGRISFKLMITCVTSLKGI